MLWGSKFVSTIIPILGGLVKFRGLENGRKWRNDAISCSSQKVTILCQNFEFFRQNS